MLRKVAVVLTLWLGALAYQKPTFRSGAEIIMVDVQVSDRDWRPATQLSSNDFDVLIDGERRAVVNTQLVRLDAAPSREAVSGVESIGTDIHEPRAFSEGRTLILGLDQASLQVANEPAAIEVVNRLLTMIPPTDRVGLVAYPQPGVSVAPTLDREAIRSALKAIGGQQLPTLSRYNVSLSEALDIQTGDKDATQTVIRRECRSDPNCPRDVTMLAAEIALSAETQALRSISGLRATVDAVREWPGRKTLVTISAGIPTSDRVGGRPDVRMEADAIGRRAAEANAVIYTLHLDVAFLTQFSARNRGRVQTVHRDAGLAANGLERFTGNAGGSLITVHAGPDQALKRLLQETSAYYLLGVETTASDRDGKTHRIQVKIKRGGLTVRSRSTVFIPLRQ